jgi:hypothetical protein
MFDSLMFDSVKSARSEVRHLPSGVSCSGENHGQVFVLRIAAYSERALLFRLRRACRQYGRYCNHRLPSNGYIAIAAPATLVLITIKFQNVKLS